MSSGDAIEAGRVTTAESTTDLLGAVPSEQDVDFNGIVILRVAPQPGRLKPNVTLDGIHGVGNNGSVGPVASQGGTGVVGFGGPNHGTGVAGQGGGVEGSGGTGVHGTGGSVLEGPSFDPGEPPGTGVVAQGGRSGNGNDVRLAHAAGVVAVAGGSGRPLPPLADTGSVGVYAQGAEAEITHASFDGVDTVIGPLAPGPGVLGRGGVFVQQEGPGAAGVIGLAGATGIPAIAETGDCGVYGAGPTGVFGHGPVGVRGRGASGPGVLGKGDVDRGGVFQSDRTAQLRLVPKALRQRAPPSMLVAPTEIPPGRGPTLPKDGRGGDLMAIELDTDDGRRTSFLWFCVQGAGPAGSARWAQVLLGSAFDGRG